MGNQLDLLLKKYQDAVQPASVERPKTRISLGPLSLNIATGHPAGVKAGRIIQIAGKYSSGKSTLALDIIAQHQKATGNAVVYVDFERALDEDYAERIGVQLDLLHVVRADTVEQGLSIIEALIKSGDIRLVVIDSIAAAKPASENDKDYDDAQKMASSAGAITRFCYRVVPLLDNHDTLLVVLNQLRMNFNTMSPEKEVPFGAKALGYNTAILIKTQAIKNTEDFTHIQVSIGKNKVAPPRQVCSFVIKYGEGIDHAQDIITLALERDIVVKAGSWLSYGGKKVQGLEKACVEFPIDEIRQKILETVE